MAQQQQIEHIDVQCELCGLEHGHKVNSVIVARMLNTSPAVFAYTPHSYTHTHIRIQPTHASM